MEDAVSRRKKEENADVALTEAIRTGNYLRAVELSQLKNRAEDEVKDLQRKALRQYVLEFRNPDGAVALVNEFKLSKEDVTRILGGMLQDLREAGQEEKGAVKARFDIEAMKYLSLEEWIRKYLKI